jgi:energy-coupling factor transporter ATP-binding protein EcfA2
VPIIRPPTCSHCYADGTQALSDVTLSFQEGEFTVIAGANGSGKTTLLRHLNGLLFPESGSVTVCGRSVKKDPLAARKQVGMVFQDADSQIVGETVYDDTAFGPENLALASAIRSTGASAGRWLRSISPVWKTSSPIIFPGVRNVVWPSPGCWPWPPVCC